MLKIDNPNFVIVKVFAVAEQEIVSELAPGQVFQIAIGVFEKCHTGGFPFIAEPRSVVCCSTLIFNLDRSDPRHYHRESLDAT